jgi:CrcB protein
MLKTIFLIGIGGAFGSILRYLTSVFVEKYYAATFPLATFIVNIIGCFLIGIVIGLLDKNQMTDSNIKWFLITGFCGGYTTFSAFGYENLSLFQSNNSSTALLYIGASIFGGLLAVYAGISLAK